MFLIIPLRHNAVSVNDEGCESVDGSCSYHRSFHLGLDPFAGAVVSHCTAFTN